MIRAEMVRDIAALCNMTYDAVLLQLIEEDYDVTTHQVCLMPSELTYPYMQLTVVRLDE